MDLDQDGLDQPPPAKRPRLSLEPVPDVNVASYDQEGNEKIEPSFILWYLPIEETPNEKFWKLVKLIDFNVVDDAKQAEQATPSKQTQEWTWANFQSNIQQASREVESILALVEWLREGKQISTFRISRPDLPARTQNFELVAAASARKQELARSASLLDAAASRLRGAVAKADRFHEQVLELRKVWRVVVPEKQPVGAYQSAYFVDISYYHDGSRARIPPIPLQKSPSGDIMIEHVSSFPLIYVSVSATEASDDQERFPVNRMMKAIGVKQCHEYLLAMQQAVWTSIAFKHISREFQLTSQAQDVSSSDSHMKLQLPGIDEQIHFRLLRRPDYVASPDAMDDDRAPIPVLPLVVALENADIHDQGNWKRLWLSMTLECALAQNAQQSQADRLKKDSLPLYSSKKIIESLQNDATVSLAATLRSTAHHLAYSQKIAQELEKIRVGVGRSLGPCRVRWLPTGHHLVSSWDFEFAVRFVEVVTLQETKIIVQNLRSLSTPTELARHLLRSICKHVIVQLFHQLRAIIGASSISKKGLTLKFPVEKSHISFSLYPEDYSIQVSIIEEIQTPLEVEQNVISWSDLPGGNHLEKVTALVRQRGTHNHVQSN